MIASSLHAELDKNMSQLYHLLPKDKWDKAIESNSPYFPDKYEKENFIHLSPTIERLISIANKYYKQDSREYIVVIIPEDKITLPARVVWEAGVSADSKREKSTSGRKWPHLYDSGINKNMVSRQIKVHRDLDGSFIIE